MTQKPKHIISTSQFSKEFVQKIITNTQSNMKNIGSMPMQSGKRIVLIFFEPSTRTVASFSNAASLINIDAININLNNSATKKGESIVDTVQNIAHMDPMAIVIRHSASGIMEIAANNSSIPIINAGDGTNQHPTQALGDISTIMALSKKKSNFKIAICGDILHSRVAKSNIDILKMFGAQITLVAPNSMMPQHITDPAIISKQNKLTPEIVAEQDVVMLLRIQKERIAPHAITINDYIKHFRFEESHQKALKTDALLLHPGPINHNIEITTDCLQHHHNTILQQARIGMYARASLLQYLMEP